MEQRNLLLAIVLSVGILIVFQFAFERMRPPQPSGSPQGTPVATSPAPATTPPAPGVSTPAPGVAAAKPALTREAVLAEQQRVKISTPRLHGSIDLVGARIDDLTLATYHDTVNPTSPEVVLLQPAGTVDAYFAQFGWAETPGIKLPSADTKWTTSGDQLTPGHPVTLMWDN